MGNAAVALKDHQVGPARFFARSHLSLCTFRFHGSEK
jgi:hypothetical protein